MSINVEGTGTVELVISNSKSYSDEIDALGISAVYSAFFMYLCYMAMLILLEITKKKSRSKQSGFRCSDFYKIFGHFVYIALVIINLMFQVSNNLVIINMNQYLKYSVERDGWLFKCTCALTGSVVVSPFLIKKIEKPVGLIKLFLIGTIVYLISLYIMGFWVVKGAIGDALLILSCIMNGFGVATSYICIRKIQEIIYERDKYLGRDRKAIYPAINSSITRLGYLFTNKIVAYFLKNSDEFFKHPKQAVFGHEAQKVGRLIIEVMVYIPMALLAFTSILISLYTFYKDWYLIDDLKPEKYLHDFKGKDAEKSLGITI
ncbi:hypothetical protein MHBO_000423 [Bonamia ostreae]|uniref:Uncharacterized protein n=1 Tax=Bonamia ostreae TaxID=126728 RepID=A0ABV2AGT4_9EUKA